MKTLIVDDHEMFRMGLGALLGQMSLDVEIHEEGTLQGGIDYVKSHADIELILVDFNLPDGNGLQLVRGLKDTHLHCRVILMSGHESQDLAVEALVAGANGFLPKSYASSEVKSALSKIVDGEFFVPEKLRMSSGIDTSTMVAGSLLSVGPNVLDNAIDPVIIFENGEQKKLEYVNTAAERLLGITKENIPLFFELDKYVEYKPLLDFINDDTRSSYMVESMHTRALAKRNLWLSVSCSKIDFLGTPSVMFYLRDITDLKNREVELEKASNTDPLTNLLNRRGFSTRANDEFSGARRHQYPLALAMCDLDLFKQLNDNYGHDFGDEVLRQFSSACEGALRDQDMVARFGGEEFVILLVNTEMEAVLTILERFRKSWQSIGHTINGQECLSTVSIGVAQLQDSDNDIDDVLKRADDLLYVCKASGRNNVSSDAAQPKVG